jgi:UDP-glucose 4-epimerase
VSLRFFNVGGAYKNKQNKWLEESHNPETHLIPNLFLASKGFVFHLYGTDWDTHDGTTIRDYVHVLDLTSACILALEKIDTLKYEVLNIGSGSGSSTFEVLKQVSTILGSEIKIENNNRRPGDAKSLVADTSKARKLIGWTSIYDLKHILLSQNEARKVKNEN